jgi:NAD(P)-dependent dehydrogenase (short-subunit alcohol dehydrogenase family)
MIDLDKLFESIKNKFDHLDIVFANAGFGEVIPFEHVSEDDFDRHFAINVKGLFFTVQKALPLLRDGSSVILNSSIAGYKGYEALSVYNATKAAVRSFARSWTNDLRARKIRVNTISPGVIDTPVYGKMRLTEEQANEFKKSIVNSAPLGRLGTADEIAKTVLFLASDDSSYITGINLSVDGGTTQI